jgi:hypothetical protein
MVHARVSEDLPASAADVFALVHDYDRRLEWDTLLREAYVEGDAAPAKGIVTVCTGRWVLGGFSLRTIYVSFVPGVVAAVKMLNRPPFFERWAASIRHVALGERESRITYTYNFRARPRFLRFLLEPILARVFRWETHRRLRALRGALQRPM